MNTKGVLEFAAKNNARFLDMRFVDLPGIWHHASYPITELTEEVFEEGFGFDASSIRGWAHIHESDMNLVPDPNTAFMDPFREIPTVVLIGDAIDPPTGKPYGRDPRGVAKRAEKYRLRRASPTRHFSGLRLSSSSLIMCASTALRSTASTLLTRTRAGGIRGARKTISGSGRARRKDTSRFLPPISTRICVRGWCST